MGKKQKKKRKSLESNTDGNSLKESSSQSLKEAIDSKSSGFRIEEGKISGIGGSNILEDPITVAASQMKHIAHTSQRDETLGNSDSKVPMHGDSINNQYDVDTEVQSMPLPSPSSTTEANFDVTKVQQYVEGETTALGLARAARLQEDGDSFIETSEAKEIEYLEAKANEAAKKADELRLKLKEEVAASPAKTKADKEAREAAKLALELAVSRDATKKGGKGNLAGSLSKDATVRQQLQDRIVRDQLAARAAQMTDSKSFFAEFEGETLAQSDGNDDKGCLNSELQQTAQEPGMLTGPDLISTSSGHTIASSQATSSTAIEFRGMTSQGIDILRFTIYHLDLQASEFDARQDARYVAQLSDAAGQDFHRTYSVQGQEKTEKCRRVIWNQNFSVSSQRPDGSNSDPDDDFLLLEVFRTFIDVSNKETTERLGLVDVPLDIFGEMQDECQMSSPILNSDEQEVATITVSACWVQTDSISGAKLAEDSGVKGTLSSSTTLQENNIAESTQGESTGMTSELLHDNFDESIFETTKEILDQTSQLLDQDATATLNEKAETLTRIPENLFQENRSISSPSLASRTPNDIQREKARSSAAPSPPLPPRHNSASKKVVSSQELSEGQSSSDDASAANLLRKRLTSFYTIKNPDKLDEVDGTVEKFLGREETLFRMLEEKYGPLNDDSGERFARDIALQSLGEYEVKENTSGDYSNNRATVPSQLSSTSSIMKNVEDELTEQSISARNLVEAAAAAAEVEATALRRRMQMALDAMPASALEEEEARRRREYAAKMLRSAWRKSVALRISVAMSRWVRYIGQVQVISVTRGANAAMSAAEASVAEARATTLAAAQETSNISSKRRSTITGRMWNALKSETVENKKIKLLEVAQKERVRATTAKLINNRLNSSMSRKVTTAFYTWWKVSVQSNNEKQQAEIRSLRERLAALEAQLNISGDISVGRKAIDGNVPTELHRPDKGRENLRGTLHCLDETRNDREEDIGEQYEGDQDVSLSSSGEAPQAKWTEDDKRRQETRGVSLEYRNYDQNGDVDSRTKNEEGNDDDVDSEEEEEKEEGDYGEDKASSASETDSDLSQVKSSDSDLSIDLQDDDGAKDEAMVQFIRRHATYMPELSSFHDRIADEHVPCAAFQNNKWRTIMWALFHEYCDDLHSSMKNQSAQSQRVRMGMTNFRRCLRALGVHGVSNNSEGGSIDNQSLGGVYSQESLISSPSKVINGPALRLANTSNRLTSTKSFKVSTAEADVLFREAAAGSWHESGQTSARRTLTSQVRLGNSPTRTRDRPRRKDCFLDFPSFCYAIEQTAKHAFRNLDGPTALFKFVEIYVLTLFEVLADEENEESRLAQEEDSATLNDYGLTKVLNRNKDILACLFEYYCADMSGVVEQQIRIMNPNSKSGRAYTTTARRRMMSFDEALNLLRDFGVAPRYVNMHQLKALWKAILELKGVPRDKASSPAHDRISDHGFLDLLARISNRFMREYCEAHTDDTPEARITVLFDIMHCSNGRQKILQEERTRTNRQAITKGFLLV